MKNTDKILVQVIFPLLSQKYDFLISYDLTVKEAKEEISREIMDFEKNDALLDNLSEYRLFVSGADNALEENTSLKEYGIVSGSRLMFV